MTGPFDFLHIKGRTAGSSNELSFDVLDAARSDLEGKKARGPYMGAQAKPSQGTYKGLAGTATLSAVPEVERRKRVRRSRRIRVRVVGVLALLALVSLGAFAGYHLYQDRMDFADRFNVLIGRFVEIDETLVKVDSLMVDPMNSIELEERDELLDKFADMESALDDIIVESQSLASEVPGESDSSALGQVEEAATARKDMLAAAEGAFTLSVVINKQVDAGNEAWNKVLAGDEAAREATETFNKASTEEAAEKARSLTEEAVVSMSTARAELVALGREVHGIDLASSLAYIDKRLEALDFALDTSDALLANDRASAIAANDAYNNAEVEASSLATALPSSIGSLVKQSYADTMQSSKDAYDAARSQVIAADSALRAYLPK